MKTFIILLSAIMLIGTLLMIYWIVNAPIGYEDDDAFHYGKEEDKP
jgi:hypothetical protein